MLNPMLFRGLVTRLPMSFASFHSSSNLTSLIRNSRVNDVAISLRALLKPKEVQKALVRHKEFDALNVNTNVQNNVMLYKNENVSQYRNIMYFGLAQFVGWGCIGFAAFTPEVFYGWYKEPNTKEYLIKYMLPLALVFTAVIAAPSVFACGWFLTVRSIKYLVLNKGGKHVTIVTHHPLKKSPTLTIPVENIKTGVARTDEKQYTPIKIVGKRFFYVLEKTGVFVNPKLYDSVVESGSKR